MSRVRAAADEVLSSQRFILGPKFGAANLGLYLMAVDTALLPVTEIVVPASDALSTGFAVAQKDGQSSAHLGPKVAATMVLMTWKPALLAVPAK